MTQEQLFYEDVFDVARAAVQHAGGAKKVAEILWPSKAAQQATKELLDCLNRESPRKLCIEEFMKILKLAKDAGFHQAKHWIDAELGYQPTLPADPVVERDRLAENMARLTDEVKNMTRAAERLLREDIKAVK
ncbi:MAG TPA: hypothetical protein VF516_03325 [Kofleriaceae bacterium]